MPSLFPSRAISSKTAEGRGGDCRPPVVRRARAGPAAAGGGAARERNQTGLLNVSQSERRPLRRPLANQVARCSDVPWLKLSGTT